MSRIFLRLDDGSLIGDAHRLGFGSRGPGAIRITVDEAFQVGLAGPPELERLQRVIASIRRQTSQDECRDSTCDSTCSASAPAPAPAAASASAQAAAPLATACDDFHAGCTATFKAILQHLGPTYKAAFWLPVERSVVAYHSAIRSPMSLSDVHKKLARRAYGSQQEFHADVALIWSNCIAYNGGSTPIGAAAAAAAAAFSR